MRLLSLVAFLCFFVVCKVCVLRCWLCLSGLRWWFELLLFVLFGVVFVLLCVDVVACCVLLFWLFFVMFQCVFVLFVCLLCVLLLFVVCCVVCVLCLYCCCCCVRGVLVCVDELLMLFVCLLRCVVVQF